MKGIPAAYNSAIKTVVEAATEFAIDDPDMTNFDVRVEAVGGIGDAVRVTLEYGQWRCQKIFLPRTLDRLRFASDRGFLGEVIKDELRELARDARAKIARTRDPNRLPG